MADWQTWWQCRNWVLTAYFGTRTADWQTCVTITWCPSTPHPGPPAVASAALQLMSHWRNCGIQDWLSPEVHRLFHSSGMGLLHLWCQTDALLPAHTSKPQNCINVWVNRSARHPHFTHTHARMHAHIHTHMHARTHVHTHTHTHTLTQTHHWYRYLASNTS